MAIARVGTVVTNSSSTNSIGLTWGEAKTTGNLLVVGIDHKKNVGSHAVTGPTNWVRAVTIDDTDLGISAMDIWYYPNCDNQSSTGNFTMSAGSVNTMSIVGVEYSGCLTASPVDKTATNTGVGTTTGDSGTTATTTQNDEVCIAGFGSTGAPTYSAPTNSFSILGQDGPTGSKGCLCEKIVSATLAANCGITLSVGLDWCGVIATFKADASGQPTIRRFMKFRPVEIGHESVEMY